MFAKMIQLLFRLLPCAFTPATMNRIHGGTITLWLYSTVDAVATVAGSAYFDAYVNDLRNGDIILVSDTNVPTIDVLVVTSANNATPVTTLNGT